MRILHVTATFPPKSFGGGTVAAYNIARCLSSRGHEVTVFTTDYASRTSRLPHNRGMRQLDGVRVQYFRNLSNRMAGRRVFTPVMMIPALRRELAGFDIVHLHDFRALPNIAVYHYARASRVPYVLQAHGSIASQFQKGGLKSAFDRIWGTSLISHAARLVAVASIESLQYQSMGAGAGRITTIPNGVNPEQFDSLPIRGRVRHHLQVSDDTKLVLYFGRVHQSKRVDILVRAFRGILDGMADALLVIAGPDDGDLKNVLHLARELGVADKIRYVGPVSESEKSSFFVDADLFVLPSPYEVFGIVILEALMCGAPTLVTDGCGMSDVIQDNGFGFVARAGDAQDMCTQMLRALDDGEWAREKSLRGREFIKRNLRWESLVEKYERLYQECMAVA